MKHKIMQNEKKYQYLYNIFKNVYIILCDANEIVVEDKYIKNQ